MAFLSMDSLAGFFAYDELTYEPLARRGWHVESISWRRADLSWDDYELVVIRSPWDYQQDPAAFLEVLRQIDASRANLHNNLQLVQWNIRKDYLRDLAARGIRIVPTCWLDRLDHATIGELCAQFDTERIVVKPPIGANAQDAFVLGGAVPHADETAAVAAFAGRELLAQPFVDSVVTQGEYSLVYLGGRYSHTVLKKPRPGDFRVQEEHGGVITSAQPDKDLVALADRAVHAVDPRLLYARVDVVRLSDGEPAVMELELIEPSLYFPYDQQSPERFADAVVERMR